jgi:hypothetical protein
MLDAGGEIGARCRLLHAGLLAVVDTFEDLEVFAAALTSISRTFKPNGTEMIVLSASCTRNQQSLVRAM